MKVFVTGDRGKLGSLAAKLLTEAGHQVVGFDVKRHPDENIMNDDKLKAAMQGCEQVVHTAGIPHPAGDPIDKYFRANVIGTLNVLKAACENGVRRVVYTSSTAYYGCDVRGKLTPAYFPIDEAHPPASVEGRSVGGLEPYNQSKVMAEQLLAYYGTNRLVQTVALRIAPANEKRHQYASFDWRTDATYRRGCFFSNCHPLWVAKAILKAIEAERPFWYEAFNVADKFTHKSVDMPKFLEREYPEVEIRSPVAGHACAIATGKAERVLGFEPCAELE